MSFTVRVLLRRLLIHQEEGLHAKRERYGKQAFAKCWLSFKKRQMRNKHATARLGTIQFLKVTEATISYTLQGFNQSCAKLQN